MSSLPRTVEGGVASSIMETVTRLPFIVKSRNQNGEMITEALEPQKITALIDWMNDNGAHNFNAASRWLAAIAKKEPAVHIPQMFYSEAREKLARKLCEIHDMHKVFFTNSGTEAVETVIKLARKYQAQRPARDVIWVKRNSFHGRTYGAMAASQNTDDAPYHHEGYGPELPGFKAFDRPEKDIDWDTALAVLITPIFDNNDVRAPDVAELKYIEHQCNRSYGRVLLIFDEVQSAHGRCGAWSAGQLYDIRPDAYCFAKGLAAGMPLGAVVTTNMMDVFTKGGHFSTFGGNNIACMMALKVLDELEKPDAMAKIERKGRKIFQALYDFARDELEPGMITDIRQIGLMIAVDTPGFDTLKLGENALKLGLVSGGFRSSRLKIYPTLDASMKSINEGLDRFRKAVHMTIYKGKKG